MIDRKILGLSPDRSPSRSPYSQGAPRGQRLEPSLTVFGLPGAIYSLMHMEQLAGNIQYDESTYD
jgi:hypothetical protein